MFVTCSGEFEQSPVRLPQLANKTKYVTGYVAPLPFNIAKGSHLEQVEKKTEEWGHTS